MASPEACSHFVIKQASDPGLLTPHSVLFKIFIAFIQMTLVIKIVSSVQFDNTSVYFTVFTIPNRLFPVIQYYFKIKCSLN